MLKIIKRAAPALIIFIIALFAIKLNIWYTHPQRAVLEKHRPSNFVLADRHSYDGEPDIQELIMLTRGFTEVGFALTESDEMTVLETELNYYSSPHDTTPSFTLKPGEYIGPMSAGSLLQDIPYEYCYGFATWPSEVFGWRIAIPFISVDSSSTVQQLYYIKLEELLTAYYTSNCVTEKPTRQLGAVLPVLYLAQDGDSFIYRNDAMLFERGVFASADYAAYIEEGLWRLFFGILLS